jgi:hypothetical protein
MYVYIRAVLQAHVFIERNRSRTSGLRYIHVQFELATSILLLWVPSDALSHTFYFYMDQPVSARKVIDVLSFMLRRSSSQIPISTLEGSN